MSDWRCPHGRIHINGKGGLSYYENLNQYGNDPAYRLFLDGTVHCATCTELNAQRMMAASDVMRALRMAL